jgi:hypothetical protein
MHNPTDSNAAIPNRLSYPQLAALRELPNPGELLKLRAQCNSEGIPFPALGPGGFLESDAVALKKSLAALHQERREVSERRKP